MGEMCLHIFAHVFKAIQYVIYKIDFHHLT